MGQYSPCIVLGTARFYNPTFDTKLASQSDVTVTHPLHWRVRATYANETRRKQIDAANELAVWNNTTFLPNLFHETGIIIVPLSWCWLKNLSKMDGGLKIFHPNRLIKCNSLQIMRIKFDILHCRHRIWQLWSPADTSDDTCHTKSCQCSAFECTRKRQHLLLKQCTQPCSCEFKLQLVPVLALGSVRAVGHEQHLLFLLLVFLLKGCWCRFMWRCLLWQVWMLFLQFYVLLVLFLRI